jgi:hypothetical protein
MVCSLHKTQPIHSVFLYGTISGKLIDCAKKMCAYCIELGHLSSCRPFPAKPATCVQGHCFLIAIINYWENPFPVNLSLTAS